MEFLQSLLTQFLATLPLYILIVLGYVLVKGFKWQKSVTDGLTKFTFSVAIPIMLFHTMSHFSEQPTADYRLLIVYFGGSFLVFLIGRIIAAKIFKLDGANGTIFAIGGIFSNNVLVGLPIIIALLGDEALPSVALIITFSALLLWTLATISIDLAQMNKLSCGSFNKVFKSLFKNPIIIGIVCGLICNYLNISMPKIVDESTSMIKRMAAPLSLIVLGMGLAEYKIKEGIMTSVSICIIKLSLLPLVVFLLANMMQLPALEIKVAVLLGSISIGINCYIMSRQFNLLAGPIASSLLISTVFSSITTPLILTILNHL